MTSQKQLKERIRARMAATGERYVTARRHVLASAGRPAPTPGPDPAGGDQIHIDQGYALRGGQHPESAAVANVLAHGGARLALTGEPASEAMVFGLGGGLGAGYILWEFAAHDTRSLVLGFRNGWQYTGRWVREALQRLGVPFDEHATSGAKGAAARLTAQLATGQPAIVWPDRYLAGYWHLPAHLEAHGGHAVVAYAERDGRVHVDDRNLRTLTVARESLDVARARVVSYKNLSIVPRPAAQLTVTADTVWAAIGACAAHLSQTSESFSLPAWRKWSRLMTDRRNTKGWPRVFADGRGLAGALLSTWEGIEAAGMTGGNLRRLYADFLTEAAKLLDAPGLADAADRFALAARAWHDVAEAALPASLPEFARLRELTARISQCVTAEGNAGADEAAQAADQLWRLRAEYDRTAPLGEAEVSQLFAVVGERLAEVHRLEVAAVRQLADAVTAAGRG